VAVGADPLAVRGSCPAVDPGQGRAADYPLDPDGGLQVAMVVAPARAALSLRRGPTPPDPSVAASRRRGRSLQISPPAVERREYRPLSSINHRTRTRLAGLSALVHFSDAATPFGRPRHRGDASCLGAIRFCPVLAAACAHGQRAALANLDAPAEWR
jgi:hypothetical protein